MNYGQYLLNRASISGANLGILKSAMIPMAGGGGGGMPPDMGGGGMPPQMGMPGMM